MHIEALNIPEIKLITPKIRRDDRGFFMETFRQDIFNEVVGTQVKFVQDNHSLSVPIGTVRGLHFQSPPHAQGKLVRCIRGSITDVAVDVRRTSPTYGQHITVELTAENGKQLWVPEGFLHGFATLESNTEVVYKVTDYYAPECDGNILWNDPHLGISWGIAESKAIISEKDNNAPFFKDFNSPFA